MAKHITENELSTQGAALGQSLVFDGTRYVPGEGGGVQDKVVATIAARDALDTSELVSGQGVVVGDASADPTVDSGAAYYKWDGSGYIKISETEVNDAISNQGYQFSVWEQDPYHAPSKAAMAYALKDLEDTLSLLAPDKAESLEYQAIGYAVSTSSVRLVAGLPAGAYAPGHSAGSTVTMTRTSAYELSVAFFRAGTNGKTATYGVLSTTTTDASGSRTEQHNLTTGTGRTGDLEVTELQPVNNFWNAASAKLYVTRAVAGFQTCFFEHTEAGQTPPLTLYYDDTTTAPTVSGFTVTVGTNNPKWLSGISYLGLGSTLLVNAQVSGAYQNYYVSGGVVNLETTGAFRNYSPPTPPANGATLALTNYLLTLNQGNVSHNNPTLTLTVRNPGLPVVETVAVPRGINTYTTSATSSAEYFVDETYRLTIDGLPFVSNQALVEIDAQVWDGKLGYTNDYVKTIASAFYVREFEHVSAATTSGQLTFGGLDATQIGRYGSGDLHIYLLLDEQNILFDLGLPFGQNNGNGSGDDVSTSRGAQVSVAGSQLNFSFGTYSSADNAGKFTMLVVFAKDSPKQLNSIVVN